MALSSATLDGKFRTFGLFLIKVKDPVEGMYYFVGRENNPSSGYNCASLKEAKSLLTALQQQAEDGGDIYHDGDEWVCGELYN